MLFRYPGGKSKLSAPIIAELNALYKPGMEYREPFFGGGSIGLKFLEHNKPNKIWINDRHFYFYNIIHY